MLEESHERSEVSFGKSDELDERVLRGQRSIKVETINGLFFHT